MSNGAPFAYRSRENSRRGERQAEALQSTIDKLPPDEREQLALYGFDPALRKVIEILASRLSALIPGPIKWGMAGTLGETASPSTPTGLQLAQSI
jgi:hypothetical protein